MRLVPPQIDPQTPSDGEKLVFKLLAGDSAPAGGAVAAGGAGGAGAAGRSGLDTSGWVALHSQDIAHHRKQMEGEADFVVVAPGLGVLVLEIKGCRRLRRTRGVWYYGADAAGDPRGRTCLSAT